MRAVLLGLSLLSATTFAAVSNLPVKYYWKINDACGCQYKITGKCSSYKDYVKFENWVRSNWFIDFVCFASWIKAIGFELKNFGGCKMQIDWQKCSINADYSNPTFKTKVEQIENKTKAKPKSKVLLWLEH